MLLDGPMGSVLTERGVLSAAGRTQGMTSWSAEALVSAPLEVAAIHRAYAEAGADLHRTNSFRTRPGDVGPSFGALAALSVRLARAEAGGAPVLGVLGPVGDCYDATAAPSEREALRAHAELAEILVSAGVDELLCETFSNVEEAKAAVRACVAFGRPVSVSLTAGPSATGMSPTDLARAADACAALGAKLVAVNCVAIERISDFAIELARTGLPFGVYANAALWNGPKASPASFAAQVEKLLAYEPAWIGVCCGGGPAHVAALRALI